MKDLLPAGWSSTSLKEITEKIGSGATPKGGESSYKPEGTPLIRSKNIIFFGFKNEGLAFLDEEQARALDNATVRARDVLLNITGASIGRVTIAPSWAENARVNQHVCIIRTHTLITPEYISAYLSSPIIQGVIEEENYGVTRQALTKKQVEEIEIPIPPISEQRRISDKLDTTLAAVEACKQKLSSAAETIQRFRQSILAAAVSGELSREWRKERGIEGEWPKVSLSDHITKPAYGTSSKSSPSGSVPVLRMGNIQNMELDWGDLVYTSDTEEIEKYKLEKGDVLFNRTNSPELVGKTAIYNGERQAIYAGYLIRVRCNNTLLPEYLNLCLNSPQGRHYCWRVKSDGVSQSNINSKKLSSYKFGLPSIEEQKQLCQQATHLLSEGKEIELKIQNALQVLNNFAKALLAKAFRGELVPQDPSDEPASALLERIKARREAEAAAKKTVKRSRKKKADAAQLVIPAGIADNHLAKVLEECGALSELALLAASELEPAVFQLQLSKELKTGALKQVDVDGEAAYAHAAWEEV